MKEEIDFGGKFAFLQILLVVSLSNYVKIVAKTESKCTIKAMTLCVFKTRITQQLAFALYQVAFKDAIFKI